MKVLVDEKLTFPKVWKIPFIRTDASFMFVYTVNVYFAWLEFEDIETTRTIKRFSESSEKWLRSVKFPFRRRMTSRTLNCQRQTRQMVFWFFLWRLEFRLRDKKTTKYVPCRSVYISIAKHFTKPDNGKYTRTFQIWSNTFKLQFCRNNLFLYL